MDIKYLRLGCFSYSDVVRGSQKRRCKDKSLIDQSIVLDIFWKKIKFKLDISKKFLNKTSRFVGKFQIIKKLKKFSNIIMFKKKILNLDKISFVFLEKRDQTESIIGNLIHNTASSGKKAKVVLREKLNYSLHFNQSEFEFNHVDLLKMVGGVDYERGTRAAGNRGYFLKGFGLLLNNSLIRYGIDFLVRKNFVALQTPFFMDKVLLSKCSQLEDFKEQLYSLNGEENKYLIATSEQPISIFHLNETIQRSAFPMKYVGFSTCFRKESGSHGKDTSGIFRVHQFEKVEQFIFCSPQNLESWSSFDELYGNVEQFYQSLDVPVKLINISSISLNNSAAKKIDLLGFFPKNKIYRELVSCSNCTFYQSRKINTKMTPLTENPDLNSVFLLNSTLCATSRVICCLLENYQTKLGISVPSILRNYTGVSFIPFTLKG